MSGYEYSEFLGKIHFWLTFIGVNLIFSSTLFRFSRDAKKIRRLSRCICGMELCFINWLLYFFNRISSIFGKYIICVYKKQSAEKNPWGEGATTLEWTVASPPPFHTFEELPKIK